MRGHCHEGLNFNWLVFKLNQFICERRSTLHMWGLEFKYQNICYLQSLAFDEVSHYE